MAQDTLYKTDIGRLHRHYTALEKIAKYAFNLGVDLFREGKTVDGLNQLYTALVLYEESEHEDMIEVVEEELECSLNRVSTIGIETDLYQRLENLELGCGLARERLSWLLSLSEDNPRRRDQSINLSRTLPFQLKETNISPN